MAFGYKWNLLLYLSIFCSSLIFFLFVNKANPPLFRIFGSLLYELFALIPIWMVSGFIYIYFLDEYFGRYQRQILQIYLWIISGSYFTYCWSTSGQTLAMRAWKIKIVSSHGHLTKKLAWKRYIFATLGTLVAGVSFIWALINKKQLYLHDLILKNYFIDIRFYKSSPRQSKRK